MTEHRKKPLPTEQPTSFLRGGAGPPQALPRGANAVLLIVSIVAVGATLATLGWVFGLFGV